jgi:hypothetical protein
MELYQTKNLHSKGNNQYNKKTTYKLGEQVCKLYMTRGYYKKHIKNSNNPIIRNK